MGTICAAAISTVLFFLFGHNKDHARAGDGRGSRVTFCMFAIQFERKKKAKQKETLCVPAFFFRLFLNTTILPFLLSAALATKEIDQRRRKKEGAARQALGIGGWGTESSLLASGVVGRDHGKETKRGFERAHRLRREGHVVASEKAAEHAAHKLDGVHPVAGR